MDIVWPLWNLACGGQRGLKTCEGDQSAAKGPMTVRAAERVRRVRPALKGWKGMAGSWVGG